MGGQRPLHPRDLRRPRNEDPTGPVAGPLSPYAAGKWTASDSTIRATPGRKMGPQERKRGPGQEEELKGVDRSQVSLGRSRSSGTQSGGHREGNPGAGPQDLAEEEETKTPPVTGAQSEVPFGLEPKDCDWDWAPGPANVGPSLPTTTRESET